MRKIIMASVVGLIIAGSLGLYAVTAYTRGPAGMKSGISGKQGYGYTQMLETKAEVLDITVEELQKGLQSGKTMLDIAKENNMTSEQLHERILEAQKERLQQLVRDGVLTQEEANARVQIMEQRQEDCSGNCDGIHHRTASTAKFGRMHLRGTR